MDLRQQGNRFMVSPDQKQAEWIHPAELADRAAGWTDCTDMSDAEFDAFMGVEVAA
jgi:hypothetical protein